MKIHGYSDQGLPAGEIRPEELAEITLVASPAELRQIAAFLSAAAHNMEQMGASYSHEHLADKQLGFNSSPHFVVFNSESTGEG
jgi:hypothetical protein